MQMITAFRGSTLLATYLTTMETDTKEALARLASLGFWYVGVGTALAFLFGGVVAGCILFIGFIVYITHVSYD